MLALIQRIRIVYQQCDNGQWTLEISPIVNAHVFKKEKKPTQGYLVFGFPDRGNMLYIGPYTKKKNYLLLIDLVTVIQLVKIACIFFLNGNNLSQDFLINMAFQSGWDTKSDFSLTEG